MNVYTYQDPNDYVVYVMNGKIVLNAPIEYSEEYQTGMCAVGANLISVTLDEPIDCSFLADEDERAVVDKIIKASL